MDMFSVLDSAGPLADSRNKTGADRACDQCKARKVRCDMRKPCAGCISKAFDCTFDKARKKRGPTGKRIAEIRRAQSRSVDERDFKLPEGGAPLDHTPMYSSDLERVNTTSSMDTIDTEVGQFSAQAPYWASASIPDDIAATVQHDTASGAAFFPPGSENDTNGMVASPLESEFVFPSLPVDSPTGSYDAFGAIPQQDLPSLADIVDIWPQHINEENLLTWIDVYFKRLHPTIPILSRANLYQQMLLRRHRTDPQYGAMLLGLCAFAMTQPVQIHERASAPSRSAQARMLLNECVKMRVSPDFGEYPTIEMVLASFFLFACLFGNSQHKAARHKLREAVDLAYSLDLHLPQSYDNLDIGTREQWLRTYLVLSVTERAYALQQGHTIGFRGRPGINARFMQAFDTTAATDYISQLIYQDQSDSVTMTGLLYLMDAFDAIDESVTECWNSHCKRSDGSCDSFDRRKALQMFRAQERAREASLTGNISFAPSAKPVPLAELVDSQQADISITQFWLLNRLWNLCLSHGLLRESSDHPELRYEFACEVARMTLLSTNTIPLSAMEVHGIGLVEKVYNIAIGIITALKSSDKLSLDIRLSQTDLNQSMQYRQYNPTVRELLQGLNTTIQSFRGGDHTYSVQFATALIAVQGYYE